VLPKDPREFAPWTETNWALRAPVTELTPWRSGPLSEGSVCCSGIREEWETSMKTFQTVDEYLAELPQEIRNILEGLRKTIRQAAPQAEEVISYNMPAFKCNGMLVWYGAFKQHIGFYPRGSALVAFKEELAGYKTSKGAIQFPIQKGIPASLVKKIIKFRLKENEQR
jgi:uncharacterized protein YdhG (YjbR/CyaY superfamily)